MLVDPRIRAGADLDGLMFGRVRTSGPSRPFMLMSAEPGFAAACPRHGRPPWHASSRRGRAVPYFEAQGHLPGAVGGIPSFMLGAFGDVATHATVGAPVSAARKRWPVLFFSPGLSLPREMYTALCADLASRGCLPEDGLSGRPRTPT
jgi:hypothetical protein